VEIGIIKKNFLNTKIHVITHARARTMAFFTVILRATYRCGWWNLSATDCWWLWLWLILLCTLIKINSWYTGA